MPGAPGAGAFARTHALLVTHPRALGIALLGFSVAQAIGAVRVAAEGQTRPAPAYWVLSGLLVAAYGVGGAYVLRAGRWSRAGAALLSAVALGAFPLGTLLGIYGLWVAWRQMGGARAITSPSRSRPRPPEDGAR